MEKAGLIKLLFGLLIFVLLNLFAKSIFNLGLHETIVFWLKMIAYCSGIWLFLLSRKQRGILKYYTSLYIISPLLVIIAYLIDGIMGAITGSIFLLFIYPSNTIISYGNYKVKTQFAGFLSACCLYNLYESKFLLFERHLTNFNADHPESELQKLSVERPGQAVLYFKPGTGDSLVIKF